MTNKTTAETPKRIWLQREEDEHLESSTYHGEGMTWCEDKINKNDIEYIRADRLNAIAKEVEGLEIRQQSSNMDIDRGFIEGAKEYKKEVLKIINKHTE